MLTSSFGGPAVHVVECSVAVLGHGVTSSVVSTDLAGPPSRHRNLVSSETELPTGVQHIELSLCKSSWPYRLAYSRELRPVLDRELARADLLRIHSLFLFPQYAAYRKAIRADVPYIVTFHGALDPYFRQRGRLRKWLTDLAWQAEMLKRAAAIHVTSKDEHALTAEIAPHVPRVLVPNGISWNKFQDLPDGDEFRNARLDGHGGPIVLSLGRVARAKAPERLVRALSEVLVHHPRTLVVFAGPDDEGLGDGLRRLARSFGVESSVRFVGMLHREERLEALGAADVLALPSHTESFGIAAAEAMAAGLPVVLTPHVKIAPDAAAAGAAIVTRSDGADLGDHLVRLLDDASLRQRLGSRAREYAKQYDWGRVGAEFVRIYRDVVATNGGQRAAT